MKKYFLKILSIFPHFIFKRIVKITNLENNKKTDTLSFKEKISDYKTINEYLFNGNNKIFKNLLSSSKIYGEYGVGISTVYASRYKNKTVIAVDSDKSWVSEVNKYSNSDGNLTTISIDLGVLKLWGTPAGYELRDNFKDYLNSIWLYEKKPDFVLIDGRFRVACFLTTLLEAKKGTLILFDDYISRPQYHIVEIFEKPIKSNKRQAVFRVSGNYNIDEIKNYINKFEYVFD